MIYLFDDRKGRKEMFISDNDAYPLICHKPFECKSAQDLSWYVQKNFQDAKVVLLHKSYIFKENSQITPDSIKKAFQSGLNIPVVLFSGGSNSNLVKEGLLVTAEINSGVMYNNLPLFHDFFAKTGTINLSLLVYGKNYHLNQLLEMQTKIYTYFFDREDCDICTNMDREELMDITDMITDKEVREQIDQILDCIDGDDANGRTVGFIKYQLQKISKIQ